MVRLFLSFSWPLALSFFLLALAGCTADSGKNDGFDSPKTAKEHPRRSQYRTFVSDEELKTKKELAQIEAQKEIALQKIGRESELKALALRQKRELALLREKERLLAVEHRQVMQRYLLIGALLLLLLAGGVLLWYFDRRRRDKLRAYEDNLKKYFHQKENEARLKIAEKILDTVASQDLGIEQKSRLIEALHGPMTKKPPSPEEQKPQREFENRTDDATIVIEPRKDEDHDDKPAAE